MGRLITKKNANGVAKYRQVCVGWIARVAALWILGCCASGWAAVKTWRGEAGDTLWSNGANWSPAAAPGSTDSITFTNLGFTDASFASGGVVSVVVDAAASGRI